METGKTDRFGKKRCDMRAAAALLIIVCLLLTSGLSGCQSAESRWNRGAEEKTDQRLHVVTTLFPYYDFLRQIAGERVRLTLVVPAGMDSHSFEPTPADMITIQNADVLVCNGGAMEQWVSRVTESFGDGPAPGRVVTMMDCVDVVEEELVEGMEAGEHSHGEEGHDHGAAEEIDEDADGHEVEIEYDEHIWTSPRNAMRMTEILTEVLAEENPENAAFFRENAAAYEAELEKLDREFQNIVKAGKRRLLVFGDKFPLRYFFDAYGLSYRAAFSGCSTDTEPSARTIAYLIDKVREDQIPVIYYLELSSPRVAEIIGEETGAEPLLFHSCHNLTRRQFESGVTYLELMEQNAVNLRKGLE